MSQATALRMSRHCLTLVVLVLGSAPAIGLAEIDAAGLFADLDANRDGQMTADEVTAEHRSLFKRLVRTGDQNSDGRLSPEELTAALEPVRAEKEVVEKQGSRLPGADALVVLLANMDGNRDGRIESDEVPATYRRAFEQFLRPGDGDKDGDLDQRELAIGAPRLSIMAQQAVNRMGLNVEAELAKIPAEQMTALDQMDAYARPTDLLADPAQAEKLFKRLDIDGDKQLTAEEAPGPLAARFEEMINRGDANRDERISRKEFLAVARRLAEFESAKPDRPAVERAYRQLLRKFDANADGQLTVREAPPRIAENFDRADADANGRLDRGELTRVAETMARAQMFAEGRAGQPSASTDQASNKAKGKRPAKKNRRPRPASN